MDESKKTPGLERQLSRAIAWSDVAEVKRLCSCGYGFGQETPSGIPFLIKAIDEGSLEIVKVLIDSGFDINVLQLPANLTPLSSAIMGERDDIVEYLLTRGADPNIGRPIIGAINSSNIDRKLYYLQLLVKHGADLNKVFDLFGSMENQFTVLDWAKDEQVRSYLINNGAKRLGEIREGAADNSQKIVRSEAVLEFFGANFGAVDARKVAGAIPSIPSISIRLIEPTIEKNYFTVFTEGLSNFPMKCPGEMQEYAFAEVFVQLAPEWYTKARFGDKKDWISMWLLKIASYPLSTGDWLGGAATLIDNNQPPRPLVNELPFTSWLLLSENQVPCADGRVVQLYRAMPLFREEREYELREGLPALVRAMDRANVPLVLEPNRSCFVP